jgi:hypothetical protein
MSALTGAIREAAEVLRADGHVVDLHEEQGMGLVLIREYPVPPGWSKSVITLLIKLPPSFPAGNPDMFWTDEDLTLPGGGIPRNGDQIEIILGRRWRRFSWHPGSWTDGADDIRTFLQFVARRLAQAV